MKKFVRVGLACLAISIGVSGVAHATSLITNGSFEDTGGVYDNSAQFITLNAPSTSITGWRVESGSVDWINSYWQPKDGSKSLDLAGSFQHGLISSDPFTTVVGQTYQVSFDMAGNPDQNYAKSLVSISTADGSLASYVFSFDQSGHTKQNMGWVTQHFNFVADSNSAQLKFGDFTNYFINPNEAWGAALDNVSVTPVPEPSTMLLLGAGLAGLAFSRRYSRRKN